MCFHGYCYFDQKYFSVFKKIGSCLQRSCENQHSLPQITSFLRTENIFCSLLPTKKVIHKALAVVSVTVSLVALLTSGLFAVYVHNISSQ